MMLDVQTISKEIIKPSSPTPQHSHKVQLSSLDQAAPQVYTHIVLFYSTNNTPNSTDQIPLKLKTSLSQTLTHFYPLAGRIELSASNTLHVDCNDTGVEFIESQTEADFDSFLLAPPIDQFDRLLPVKVTEFRWPVDPLLALQVSMFRGNGMALGISMSHLIADGASIASFLNCWANIARGINLTSSEIPYFDSATVFPPQSNLSTRRPLPDHSSSTGNVLIKRFVMSADAIERLQKGHCDRTEAPTRVEAVSALVWRCLDRMRGNAGTMVTSVNIRKKVSGLSDRSFGNLWIAVPATEARRVNEEYVRRRESGGWAKEEGVKVRWILSSWCRIRLYGSDFGWGEPLWLGCGIRDMKDVCILIDAKGGDGIEVWLWLERGEMERVERDEEFLQFVSI